jgi:hypothetical protein
VCQPSAAGEAHAMSGVNNIVDNIVWRMALLL